MKEIEETKKMALNHKNRTPKHNILGQNLADGDGRNAIYVQKIGKSVKTEGWF